MAMFVVRLIGVYVHLQHSYGSSVTKRKRALYAYKAYFKSDTTYIWYDYETDRLLFSQYFHH